MCKFDWSTINLTGGKTGSTVGRLRLRLATRFLAVKRSLTWRLMPTAIGATRMTGGDWFLYDRSFWLGNLFIYGCRLGPVGPITAGVWFPGEVLMGTGPGFPGNRWRLSRLALLCASAGPRGSGLWGGQPIGGARRGHRFRYRSRPDLHNFNRTARIFIVSSCAIRIFRAPRRRKAESYLHQTTPR